jgi:hypothetical protein
MVEATAVAAAPLAALPKEDAPVMKQPKPPAVSLKKVGMLSKSLKSTLENVLSCVRMTNIRTNRSRVSSWSPKA